MSLIAKKELSVLLCVAALALLCLAGCANSQSGADDSEATSLSFSIDAETSRQLGNAAGLSASASARSADINALTLDIAIHGDYEASQTASITPGTETQISFDEVPVGASIYAEASIYYMQNGVKVPLGTGRSQSITVQDGSNSLSVPLNIGSPIPSFTFMRSKVLCYVGGYGDGSGIVGTSYGYIQFETVGADGALHGTVYHYDYYNDGSKAHDTANTNPVTYNGGIIKASDGFETLVYKIEDKLYQAALKFIRTSGTGLDSTFQQRISETQTQSIVMRSNGTFTFKEGETEIFSGTYTNTNGFVALSTDSNNVMYYGYYNGSMMYLGTKDANSELLQYNSLPAYEPHN